MNDRVYKKCFSTISYPYNEVIKLQICDIHRQIVYAGEGKAQFQKYVLEKTLALKAKTRNAEADSRQEVNQKTDKAKINTVLLTSEEFEMSSRKKISLFE